MATKVRSSSESRRRFMILKNLVADELAIHFAYPSPGGKVSAMEPDRRNLLQHFDDPPATWGSLVGGLAILLLLLAAVTSWDFIAVLFGCLDADGPPAM